MERKNVFLGVILIMTGVIMALTTMNLIPKISFLFVVAGGFLVAYAVFNRNIGFLIPGCILAAVATFITLGDMYGYNGSYILILLGVAFCAVFLIHTAYIKTSRWGERYWPLFPGTILLIIGTLLHNAITPSDPGQKLINIIIPVLLIVIGVFIVFGSPKRSS